MTQTVEPAVSRAKFDEEVGRLATSSDLLRKRGIWVMSAEFPTVDVAFITPAMKPRILALAVRIDFTDYDASPPSVRFWDPFEDRELLSMELLTRMPKLLAPPAGAPPLPPGASPPHSFLAQSHGMDKPAFVCLPGVREYHEHPAHTGDAWELHRRIDGGALFDLVETLWRYGSAPLTQFSLEMKMTPQQTAIPA